MLKTTADFDWVALTCSTSSAMILEFAQCNVSDSHAGCQVSGKTHFHTKAKGAVQVNLSKFNIDVCCKRMSSGSWTVHSCLLHMWNNPNILHVLIYFYVCYNLVIVQWGREENRAGIIPYCTILLCRRTKCKPGNPLRYDKQHRYPASLSRLFNPPRLHATRQNVSKFTQNACFSRTRHLIYVICCC